MANCRRLLAVALCSFPARLGQRTSTPFARLVACRRSVKVRLDARFVDLAVETTGAVTQRSEVDQMNPEPFKAYSRGCGRSAKVQKRPQKAKRDGLGDRFQATPGSHFVICVSLDDKGKECRP